jgi:hypothetical protein
VAGFIVCCFGFLRSGVSLVSVQSYSVSLLDMFAKIAVSKFAAFAGTLRVPVCILLGPCDGAVRVRAFF